MYSSRELFEMIRSNLNALARALDGVYPDEPYPDPRDIALYAKHTPFDKFMENMNEHYELIGRQLDVNKLFAEITLENREIANELRRRVP